MYSVLLDFTIDDLKEHHSCIKFGLEFRKTASETYEMLRMAFSDIATGRTLTSERFLPWGEH